MYNIDSYARMIADSIRTQAYADALRLKLKPQSVVLDIGTGIGLFALLACQYGARRVYAIEPNDAIQVAREVAVANGFDDRIEFIQDSSIGTTLPERVDLIVSDLRGVLPFFCHHIPSIADARERFLAPGGALIPQSDTLWVALADAPELYEKHVIPFDHSVDDLNIGAARRILINTWRKARVESEQLLVEPRCWATLNYATVRDPDACGQANWERTRAGTAHGLIVWFDTTLADGVELSNAPGKPDLIYGAGFFPWPEPVFLDIDDRIEVGLRADLIGEDYVWCWNTRVVDQRERVKADFKQSTVQGTVLSLEKLKKRAHSHIPVLAEDGQIDLFILSLMDGRTAQGDLARRVTERFPARFAKWEDALTRVGEVSQRYSR